MKEKIELLLTKIKEKRISQSHRFIPYIKKDLERMLVVVNNEGGNVDELKIIARGLSRIITDDYDFMDTTIGIEVGELCSEIHKM